MEIIVQQNPQILNIELAAGFGNFGELYYPLCFLTDLPNVDSPLLHFYCDARDIHAEDNRFEYLIVCNPYSFGFQNEASALPLLQEWTRVLKNGGSVILIGHTKNAFIQPQRLQKFVGIFNNSQNIVEIKTEICAISAENLYPNYTFYNTDRRFRTIPNLKILLYVKK